MKIIAFGASTSRASINKTFATYVASQFSKAEIEVLDLNDYPLPLFSIDLEKEVGIPENAKLFYDKLKEAELIVISIAEHNGSYTAGFKNLFDWVSRHELKMFADKKLILVSTAPGARGGISALEAAKDRFPRHGGEIVMSFSLPNFGQNFSPENGIFNESLFYDFNGAIEKVKEAISY
jgi:chromate reductase